MRSWRAAGGPSKTSWKKFESQMLDATHHEIAVCAYCIWLQEGKPEGRALDHWLQAELQLVLSSILRFKSRKIHRQPTVGGGLQRCLSQQDKIVTRRSHPNHGSLTIQWYE
jgi:hypothetical protein